MEKKLKEFSADKIVIPYHLFMDEAQVNNALGSHKKPGKLNLGYYSFPTIPTEYQSRLENIFVALVHPGAYTVDYGNETCYSCLIEVLTNLTKEGITLNIDGEEIDVVVR